MAGSAEIKGVSTSTRTIFIRKGSKSWLSQLALPDSDAGPGAAWLRDR
jgi:hypothetical protein